MPKRWKMLLRQTTLWKALFAVVEPELDCVSVNNNIWIVTLLSYSHFHFTFNVANPGGIDWVKCCDIEHRDETHSDSIISYVTQWQREYRNSLREIVHAPRQFTDCACKIYLVWLIIPFDGYELMIQVCLLVLAFKIKFYSILLASKRTFT